MGQVKTIY